MMLESNIPLEKADHPAMREWLNTHVEGAGDLPSANTLRETYVPKIGQSNKEAVRHAVEDKQIVFLCDETTDKVGRCIFVVLIRVLRCSSVPLMYVGGVKELTAATGSECSRAILSIVAELGIKFENVVGVITDSAKYMTTCVTSLKCVFSDGMVHVQCWAHKLNIIASLWSANLTELNMCVANAKHAFVNARKRKHRYMSFLKDKYPEDETKHVLFPLPIMTRWTSWYKSANYVGEHVDDLVEFLSAEEEGSSAIVHFKNLSQDDVAVIKCSSVFLIEHCIKIIDSIVLLEGANYAFSHQVYPILMDLKNTFTLISRGILGEDTCTSIAKLSTQVKQHSLRENLVSVGLKCVTKLSDLMNRDSGKDFILHISKLFHPSNVSNNVVDEKLYKSSANKIPILCQLSQTKFLEGYLAYQYQVSQLLAEMQPVDVVSVLMNMQVQHSEFVQHCVTPLWIPSSNADSERAFSAYSHILADRRTNLKAENLEILFTRFFGSKAESATL